MNEDKPIELLEIIKEYGENSFDDSWLDLSDGSAYADIARNFGRVQRKINELVGAVNKLNADFDFTKAEDAVEDNVDAAVAEMQALHEADRKAKDREREQELMTTMIDILNREKLRLIDTKNTGHWSRELEHRLFLVEILIEGAINKP